MASAATSAFDRKISQALGELDVAASRPALDAVADPDGARAALEGAEAGAVMLLRVMPEISGGSQSYAPDPVEPAWVVVTLGSADVEVASPDGGAARSRRAARITIDTLTVQCCDAPSCTLEKVLAGAWLVLDFGGDTPRPGPGEDTPHRGRAGDTAQPESERLLVAEALDVSQERARGSVRGVAAALARALGVALDPAPGTDVESGSDAPPRELATLPAASIARFALRTEGTGLVLRDHASAGPRARARRLLVQSALLAAVAAGLWALVARSVAAGSGTGAVLGFGALAALVTLTAYAFFGVARFAGRYSASSAPLLWLGQDRLTAAPWVSRTGAVDLRPEGRFGASIPLGELRAVEIRDRDGVHVIELDTDHGPIDVLTTDDAAVAAFWSEVIRRVARRAAHPEAKTSARQRARQRTR